MKENALSGAESRRVVAAAGSGTMSGPQISSTKTEDQAALYGRCRRLHTVVHKGRHDAEGRMSLSGKSNERSKIVDGKKQERNYGKKLWNTVKKVVKEQERDAVPRVQSYEGQTRPLHNKCRWQRTRHGPQPSQAFPSLGSR